ncbi:hypothetical protein BJ322DRAFT_9352 [Thelephora terrestris]|uniref:Uncharacterized protein n=1 Tax=Thelephora terrestris TaxID=56493 RepID=A0A9P6LBU3_9AGAM|nr:hypothetical protein BJ322DRAFT_9352 [Thelephora terrestris]
MAPRPSAKQPASEAFASISKKTPFPDPEEDPIKFSKQVKSNLENDPRTHRKGHVKDTDTPVETQLPRPHTHIDGNLLCANEKCIWVSSDSQHRPHSRMGFETIRALRSDARFRSSSGMAAPEVDNWALLARCNRQISFRTLRKSARLCRPTTGLHTMNGTLPR